MRGGTHLGGFPFFVARFHARPVASGSGATVTERCPISRPSWPAPQVKPHLVMIPFADLPARSQGMRLDSASA